MNLTPAQQQLSDLSLKYIMGDSGLDPEFSNNLGILTSKIWSEFIDEEISDLLSEDQLIRLGELLEDDETTEQNFLDFFNECVPNFEEMYLEKVLDNKAVLVEGRIKQLRLFTDGETDKQLLLDECEELIKKGEWLIVQDTLATEFIDY